MTTLKGKSALVTGSTSGIGLAVARALAVQGCDIMLNGFGDADEIENLRAGIAGDYGVMAHYSDADMSIPDDIEALIATMVQDFGGVDIVVNNAGIQHVAPVDEFAPEMWEKIIAINLSSAFYTTHYALPHMRKGGWGRIVNIASAHGLVASANKAGYVAAKHGLTGLSKVTALETAKENITCNSICPGWVLTPLVQKQIDKIAREQGLSDADAKHKLLSEKQPSGEFVQPEQIGELVCFLCSDAASQITGSNYAIDGGWTAQ